MPGALTIWWIVAGVIIEMYAASTLAPPRDDCIEESVARLMKRQLGVLEARAEFFVSRMLRMTNGTRISRLSFPPRYVGVYGGRRRSNTSEDLYDSSCTGAMDNKARVPSRFGTTVLVNFVLPALVHSLVFGMRHETPLDNEECFDYISFPNLRFHLAYYGLFDRVVEAHMNMWALHTLVDAMQDASIPGLVNRRRHVAKVAIRSKRSHGSFTPTLTPHAWSLNPIGVECFRVDITREFIDKFVNETRTRVEDLQATTRGRFLENEDNTTTSCDEATNMSHFLYDCGKDKSLERIGYELGYTVAYDPAGDWLARVVQAEDVCGTVPMHAKRDKSDRERAGFAWSPPVQYLVWLAIWNWQDAIANERDEAVLPVCTFMYDLKATSKTSSSTNTSRRSNTSTSATAESPAISHSSPGIAGDTESGRTTVLPNSPRLVCSLMTFTRQSH